MRPRKLRRLLALAGLGGILAGATVGAGTGIARADGELSNAEWAYVYAYGAGAICPTLDNHPSAPGVLGIASAIMDDGFSGGDAADIINASVQLYCPRHWGLLVRIGQQARGEIAGYIA